MAVDVSACMHTHKHMCTLTHTWEVFMIILFLTNQALLFAPNEDGVRNQKLGMGF